MDIIKLFIEHSLYPLMEKRRGNQIRNYLADLRLSCKKPEEIIIKDQQRKLTELLQYAVDQVPAYEYLKESALEGENLFFDIQKFPILTKSIYKANADRYLARNSAKENLILNRTGGSTSEPVEFYMDRRTVEYYEAARWRGLSWWGITPGSRCVMIWGNAIELNASQSRSYRRKDRYLKNRIIIQAYHLQPDRIQEYIDQINRYRPEYLYGYASALEAFANMMIKKNLKLSISLKAVVSTAETLHPHQRESIEKAFACKTVNEYGARDAGILAYECKAGNMHITAENAYLEVVDKSTGSNMPEGETGELLVTDLNNFAMPRLRYMLGDRGSISHRKCSCDINLPLLERIDGREDDMLVSGDGTFVHGHIFNHLARLSMKMAKFQIVQHSREDATLKLVPEKNASEKDIEQFIDDIKSKLPGVEMAVELVQDIPTPPSGKYRYAIRAFDLSVE